MKCAASSRVRSSSRCAASAGGRTNSIDVARPLSSTVMRTTMPLIAGEQRRAQRRLDRRGIRLAEVADPVLALRGDGARRGRRRCGGRRRLRRGLRARLGRRHDGGHPRGRVVHRTGWSLACGRGLRNVRARASVATSILRAARPVAITATWITGRTACCCGDHRDGGRSPCVRDPAAAGGARCESGRRAACVRRGPWPETSRPAASRARPGRSNGRRSRWRSRCGHAVGSEGLTPTSL